MIVTLNVTEDSRVELVKDQCEAVQGEHNVTVLNINFPTTIKGYPIENYTKQIEFAECKEVGECVKFLDELEGNTYKLCKICTQFEKLMIQFTLRNTADETEPIIWKTIPVMLEFCESINAENTKEAQATLLNLVEIKEEWTDDLHTTKNEWTKFVTANCFTVVYKAGNIPTPDTDTLDKTIFYLGANTSELTYGHYYRCVNVNNTYKWTDLTQDPSLADVANGVREINKNRSMQFWVGSAEELAQEETQENTLYIPEVIEDDDVLKVGDVIIPHKVLVYNKTTYDDIVLSDCGISVGDIIEIETYNGLQFSAADDDYVHTNANCFYKVRLNFPEQALYGNVIHIPINKQSNSTTVEQVSLKITYDKATSTITLHPTSFAEAVAVGKVYKIIE